MSKFEDSKKEATPEEFDFYANPGAKPYLRRFREELNKLPADERLYEADNYAVRKKIAKAHHVDLEHGQKVPKWGSVTKQYIRMTLAYKWLRKLEEQEVKNTQEHVEELSNPDLPF